MNLGLKIVDGPPACICGGMKPEAEHGELMEEALEKEWQGLNNGADVERFIEFVER